MHVMYCGTTLFTLFVRVLGALVCSQRRFPAADRAVSDVCALRTQSNEKDSHDPSIAVKVADLSLGVGIARPPTRP